MTSTIITRVQRRTPGVRRSAPLVPSSSPQARTSALSTGEIGIEFDALVADIARPREMESPLQLVAPDLLAPNRPTTGRPRVAQPRRVSRRGIVGWYSRRVTAVTAGLAAAVLGVGIVTTGAYFTDALLVPSSASVGTVNLDFLTSAGAPATTYSISDVVPLSTADAADTTKGSFATLRVKGATLATKARLHVQVVTSGTTAAALPYLRMQTSTGAQWTAAVTPTTSMAVISDQFL
ncbi:MAG: hypothetical protein ABWZ77_01280, partial [Naasia sp.]